MVILGLILSPMGAYAPSNFFEIVMLDIILESLFWWSAIETELEIEQEDLDEEH